ncbi:hypothetical protein Terro_1912 [Terriglobus roseus DSM 18391]|uniref:Uncharacterized protein n=1 Tax=Terriglobus roseus (strain DSM 18391 / NRRL B-41598 / KBS 63) TaxID=926566 RepID=I3ZG34_TERRK|nr:hypothetical protein [Terriglobus roseus]AFL88202.1 hypothetical protein Terro_1912 [Terriglobus roseus DSM 18391]
MRRLFLGLALGMSSVLTGCHSHYIQATITNASDAPLNVVQVDYPSASFGTQLLAPGASFHYRFKLLGSGNIKVSFIDAAKHEHAQTGPWLNEGQEGTLDITLPTQDHADFHTSLKP